EEGALPGLVGLACPAAIPRPWTGDLATPSSRALAPAQATEILQHTIGVSTTPMLSSHVSAGGRNPLSTSFSLGGIAPSVLPATVWPTPCFSFWVQKEPKSFGSLLATPAATICRPPTPHLMCGVRQVVDLFPFVHFLCTRHGMTECGLYIYNVGQG